MGLKTDKFKSVLLIQEDGSEIRVDKVKDVIELNPYDELVESIKALRCERDYLKEKVRCLEEKCSNLEGENQILRGDNIYYKNALDNIYNNCEVFYDTILYKNTHRPMFEYVRDAILKGHIDNNCVR